MMRFSLVAAIWLIPTGVMAQTVSTNFDSGPGFVAPLSTIGSGEHPPSTTETSPSRAHTVRRGGHTIALTHDDDTSQSGSGAATKMANAGS